MGDLRNLLILYAGIVLINCFISAILWYKQKTKLSLQLLTVWTATFFVYLLQGMLQKSDLLIIVSFSFTFFINITISEFLTTLTNEKRNWKYVL